jgi:phage shock protein A
MTWAEAAPTLLVVVPALLAAWFLFRHGGSTALAELERANRILERRVHELEAENRQLTAAIASLRARTDVATALEPLSQLLATQHGEAMTHFSQLETLLGMVADRLGPEPNGD